MASTSATQDIPSPPEFTFKLADTRLKITYKNALAYAHVYSGAMVQASPVWKNFIFPPWSIQQGASTKTEDILTALSKLRLEPEQDLDFTEDNAEALLVLLSIAHLQIEEILNARPPKTVLVNIAILCDAYFYHDLVRPWVSKWMGDEWSYEKDYWFEARHCWRRKPDNLGAMILVAWVFRPVSKHHYFKKGLEWLYGANRKDDLPEFPEHWPLPANLISKVSYSRSSKCMILTIRYREYLGCS